MRRSTRAQVQVGESLAVIFVFIILLIFGLAWWASANEAGSAVVVEEEVRLQLLATTKEVMNLPELRCSIASKNDATCVDRYRALALKDLLVRDADLRRQYSQRFDGYTISVRTLYPDRGSIDIMDFTPANYESSHKVAVPVVLYDPLTGERAFSMLLLTQYSGVAS